MCGILFGCCLCTLSSEKSCTHTNHSVELGLIKSDCKSDEPKHAEHVPRSCTTDIYGTWMTDSLIDRRGPDGSKLYSFELMNDVMGLMRGCILHLRGEPTHQPVIDSEGNALLWNGEIFDGINVDPHENDTQILSNLLSLSTCSPDDNILKILEQINGPWSFIYWQAKKKCLWFGRDMYGRRSLLWHLPSSQSQSFSITSVAVGDLDYTEIPAVGIFSIDCSAIPSQSLVNKDKQFDKVLIKMTLHPWLHCRWPETRDLVTETDPKDFPSILKYSPSHVSISVASSQILQHWIPCMITSISKEDTHIPNQRHESTIGSEDELVKILESVWNNDVELRDLSKKLITSLQMAVEKRINNLPTKEKTIQIAQEEFSTSKARIAILFSGGLDSSVLAALADRCVPIDESIDLLNVAFEQPAPEPIHLKLKLKQKTKAKKLSKHQSKFESLEENVSNSQTAKYEQTPYSAALERIPQLSMDENLLESSKSSFLSEEDRKQSSASNSTQQTFHNKKDTSGILSKDLSLSENKAVFDPYDVPDRKTGKLAYSELCRINPSRKWNFIEINVTQEELMLERKLHIRKLIYPLCTVLDDSIGCALWFAARGKGELANGRKETVVSRAKVVLCGMAADEQFAGYSRHRAHFNKFGWEGLICQLQEEIWRISQRNLGRDDRIISDHGKEARFPFLDEKFTKFVSEIPVNLRANLHLPRGIGEKLLLRISAFTLGLRLTSCQAKRAIQFGSKIAKLDKAKEKGSDVCERLL